MINASHRSDPVRRDRHNRRAGIALYQAADTCTDLADGLGVRRETASRWRNGAQSPVGRWLSLIDKLTRAGLSASSLIIETEATEEAALMAAFTPTELVARYHAIPDRLTDARAKADQAQREADRTGHTTKLERARQEEAGLIRDQLVLLRLFKENEIDPRDPEWRTA